MRFVCSYKWKNGRKEQWFGEITKVNDYGSYIELYIASRSSLWVVCGKGEHSNWACIPNYQAGCVLSYLDDTFYNTERLMMAIKNKVDAVTVAEALKILSKQYAF